MSAQEAVRLVRHHADPRFAAVGEIVLDRPEKRNALTPGMLARMRAMALELEADDSCRVVVIRGEGAVFCAGFDLSLCRENSEALAEMLRGLSTVVRTLRRLRRPVVIAAHGAAVAGGCALLGGADIVITNKDAKLGYPVVKLGISPAVSTPFLTASVGMRAARQRELDPDLISGEEAVRVGLADRCVDIPEDVIPRAQLEATQLAEKPPGAISITKAWLNEIDGTDQDAQAEHALAASLSLVGSDEERRLLAQLWK